MRREKIVFNTLDEFRLLHTTLAIVAADSLIYPFHRIRLPTYERKASWRYLLTRSSRFIELGYRLMNRVLLCDTG